MDGKGDTWCMGFAIFFPNCFHGLVMDFSPI
jgi:hypothetical protein